MVGQSMTETVQGVAAGPGGASVAFAQTRALFDVVRIRDVRLMSCATRGSVDPERSLILDVGRDSTAERTIPDRVTVDVAFRLTGRAQESESRDALLSIEATFRATYTIPTDTVTDTATLRFFAATNGVFNLWPYWREFVQSASLRMGFHGIVVPTLRIEESFSGAGTINRRNPVGAVPTSSAGEPQ